MSKGFFLTLLVTALAGLNAASGQGPALGQSPPRQQRKQAPPTVVAQISRDVAPSNRIQMTLNTRNVPVVQIKAYPIDAVEWLKSQSPKPLKPDATGPVAKAWSVSVATKDNPPNAFQIDRFYSRQVNLPPILPGVYRLDVSGGGASYWTVVNITNLGVVVKESSKHLLVWVTDALKGNSVEGARVTVFDPKLGKQVSEGKSRTDGTYFENLRPGTWQVVVSRGRDYAGLPTDGNDPNGRLVAHFQTDRPVYRPGQKIQFKAILRWTQDTAYRVAANSDVQVELRDPKDSPIDRVKLRSNDMGSVAGQFDLPAEGAIGPYSLVLAIDNQTAFQSVNVAEYRKPEYQVAVDPVAKRYFAGDKIQFKVSAQYYFGAPVAQAEVRYSVRRDTTTWSNWNNERYNDGNLYPSDSYNLQPFVAEDVVHTANNGEAVIEVTSDPKAPDSDYSIVCTVTDNSRRVVVGNGDVPVYASSIRLAVSTDVLLIPIGKLIPLTLQAVDVDGKPSAANVTLIETHQVWNEKKSEYETTELARTTVKIPASGRVRATMPAAAQEDIVIEARANDSSERLASDFLSVYVVGPREKTEREAQQPSISTKLNRRSYSPGDIVSSHLLANTRKWPILMTVEGQDIYNYRVLQGSGDWEFRTDKDMSPNAFVNADQWVKGQLISSNEIVPLPNADVALSLQLTPDKPEYRPGDQATYQVKTLDKNGRPVAAEVAINVVDAAIYAVSPDNTANLYQRFWGIRGNQVVMHQAAPEELSGGAYQNQTTVAPLRQQFKDTAYWNAFAETGSDGTGSITFEMPGNLTTWKAWARAVTTQTQVGTADSSVVATRPVTLRLATPRQMAKGDHLTIIGTVNNRTAANHEFKVSLKAEGLVVDTTAELTLAVPAKSEGEVQWSLTADHIGAQPPALTAQAVCTDVSDGERPGYSDALRLVFPVTPDGVPIDLRAGGVVTDTATVSLNLPADRIEPATKTTVCVWSGVKPILDETVKAVLDSYRYGTMPCAKQLELWTLAPADANPKELREILAHLSRAEHSDGWGYWDSCQSDPSVTAEVLRALSLAKNVPGIPERMFGDAQHAAEYQYAHTNLWEYRALLADALALSDSPKGKPWLDEVLAKGQNMSPHAKLRLAEGLNSIGEKDQANAQVEALVPTVSEGPTSAFLPVGEGIGWSANDTETTGEFLNELLKAGLHTDLQSKLAEWLVAPNSNSWPSLEDQAGKALALRAYLTGHPSSQDIGQATVVVGGVSYPMNMAKIQNELLAEIPGSALKSLANQITISHQGPGEVFFEVDSTVFRPLRDGTDAGIRVSRRYEAKNSAGIWEELKRPVKAGETIRCTDLIWGDSVPDVVRLISPLPAGFEYVDEDDSSDNYGSETEVRDGAVVYYVVTAGKPVFFSYYIRPEAEGDVAALPASAEVLRRPDKRGQSESGRLSIQR